MRIPVPARRQSVAANWRSPLKSVILTEKGRNRFERQTPVRRYGWPLQAFTLLEVIIACSIFFMVAFAILGMVTSGLAQARALRQRDPDAGMLAATLSLTTQLEE